MWRRAVGRAHLCGYGGARRGYTARALGEAIFTEADDIPSLRERVRDAVRCHFEEGQAPKVVRLHFVRDDVIAV